MICVIVWRPSGESRRSAGAAKTHALGQDRGETEHLISIMRSHSYRNIGNLNCPLLYRHAFNHSKRLIEDFQEVAKPLKAVMSSDLSGVRKLELFGEMRHAVGRSALLLSGGAIPGM
ncbi:unnamed protein product [Sphagnum balticum]